MASYNKTTKGSMRTANKSGHVAYKLDDELRLVTMALTTMLGEPKYYGDNTDELIKLAEVVAKKDPRFVAQLAVWCRTVGNLRSVSHALCAVAAHVHKSPDGVPSVVRSAVRAVSKMRGDDGAEIVATYLALYGKPIPNSLRKGVRDALNWASDYSIAKYQLRGRSVTMRDVLRIEHPVPRDEAARKAMGACVAGTLSMPKGWETELSSRGNNKDVWNELIHENRLGYAALLRNLRNIVNCGADLDAALAVISDHERVRKSRQLPFRFWSAYREVGGTKVARALDEAMMASCANVDRLPGRTAVLIDRSGSMNSAVSRRSTVLCADIAKLLGAMASFISDDALVIAFNDRAEVVRMAGTSIIGDASMVPRPSGSTNMHAGFVELMASGFDADRVIVLSDNEVNSRGWWSSIRNVDVIQKDLEAYRKRVGHDVWCHAIDLQGYGTSQFVGRHVNVMAGWSEQLLRFVSLTEMGSETLLGAIRGVDL